MIVDEDRGTHNIVFRRAFNVKHLDNVQKPSFSSSSASSNYFMAADGVLSQDIARGFGFPVQPFSYGGNASWRFVYLVWKKMPLAVAVFPEFLNEKYLPLSKPPYTQRLSMRHIGAHAQWPKSKA